MPPQYITLGHTDYCELKFLRNSRHKDILTSFVSPKAGNEFLWEGTLLIPGRKKVPLLPEIGSSGPRRLYKQILLLLHKFTPPSSNPFLL